MKTKLIVAGGRDFNDYKRLEAEILAIALSSTKVYSIVSGMARGADALAVHFARENNVLLYEMPADWDKYGKRAGYVRNNEMAKFADELLAFWDGKSKGTGQMIQAMYDENKPVTVILY